MYEKFVHLLPEWTYFAGGLLLGVFGVFILIEVMGYDFVKRSKDESRPDPPAKEQKPRHIANDIARVFICYCLISYPMCKFAMWAQDRYGVEPHYNPCSKKYPCQIFWGLPKNGK